MTLASEPSDLLKTEFHGFSTMLTGKFPATITIWKKIFATVPMHDWAGLFQTLQARAGAAFRKQNGQ